jgi:hypothetical protein
MPQLPQRPADRDDEYFLLEFSDSPRITEDFTTDVTKLQNRLLLTNAKGSTSLYDALYLGLERVTGGNNSRKAVLLITDGNDNHSCYSFSEVKEFAKEHDVQIYAIGIEDETSAGAGYSGRGLLEDLANLTGGRAFFPPSINDLENICALIGVDLKNQYVLGYRPLNRSNDGKWRKVRVKINRPKGMPPLSVRAKTGYYASTIAKAVKQEDVKCSEPCSIDHPIWRQGFLYTGASLTNFDVPGAFYTNAIGINDSGQIVGYFDDATGIHGFLATPTVVPEPRSLPLLAAGLIGLGAMARYRKRA